MAKGMTEQLFSLSENVVKAVIAKYLTDIKKVKAKPTRGAGPDFVFGGQIIETKGSDSGFDRTVRQMLEYAPKYTSLTLAVPIGFFTAQRVLQLNTLAKVIYKQHMRMLTILSIKVAESVEVGKPPSAFMLGELQALSLASNVIERIGEMNEWVYPDTLGKPKNYEAERIRDIDTVVRAAIASLTTQVSGYRIIHI